MLLGLQRLVGVAGLLLLTSAGGSFASYHRFQAKTAEPSSTRLEIPRLKVSVAVLDNDDEHSLSLAAGHIQGTSPIGSLGNAGIAGHRDTCFRALRNIRVGDRIETQSRYNSIYVVDSIHIVDPSDTRLLDLNTTPSLTLVTCYPFDFLGSAPKRFVVQAKLIQ